MLIIEKLPTRYAEGSATVAANEVTVTPTDAIWYGNVWGDDLFFDPAQPLVPPQRIASVNEDGTLTLAYPWPGDTMTEAPYEVRYIGIIERSTAQTRRVIEELGKISPYYDVQVDTLADRDGYDDRPTGFAVLVANTGDGRAAIYSKNSATSGDWSDPAYVTGPAVTLDVGNVTPVAFGNDPDVTLTPVAGGYEFDFELPENATFQSGTITTLPPGSNATFSLSPVAGGYALNLGVPRGPTGDIDGVTSFWQSRITVDETRKQALAGLIPGELGVFLPPNFAVSDLTPSQMRDAVGAVSGFYSVANTNGGIVTLPPEFTSATGLLYGVLRGFTGDATDYTSAWQELTGVGGNHKWIRHGSSGSTWTPFAEFLHSGNIDPWAAQPLGVPIPLLDNVVAPPPTTKNYRYIKLTASDAYNDGVLADEIVTGSAPLVVATATIWLLGSPFSGQSINLINTERRFLRAGNPGSVETDQMQQMIGSAGNVPHLDVPGAYPLFDGPSGAFKSKPSYNSGLISISSSGVVADSLLFDSASSPGARAGEETRSKNIGVTYFMRVL